SVLQGSQYVAQKLSRTTSRPAWSASEKGCPWMSVPSRSGRPAPVEEAVPAQAAALRRRANSARRVNDTRGLPGRARRARSLPRWAGQGNRQAGRARRAVGGRRQQADLIG